MNGAPGSTNDLNSDLGFGSVVSRESRNRLLNRDGSFNVKRSGLGVLESLSPYHWMMSTTWPRFLAAAMLLFVLMNAIFAVVYMACGPGALSGASAVTPGERFAEDFFFSVHTLATIGYGTMAPRSLAANIAVSLEAVTGLLGFSIVTGAVFARFARPSAKILFSNRAVIAPFGSGTAFMFRIANQRATQLVGMEAKVMYTRRRAAGGRDYVPLPLEREKVVFFPLAWTIVHPITESSPLHGATSESLSGEDAEILVLLGGFDEVSSQTVQARSSYKVEEIAFGKTFRSMFTPNDESDSISVDLRRIHDIELAGG
ncbi:MAG: ion channel [Thermoanaerobaculia bacterium]|jgi:inward rectifier potassium channel